MPKKVQDELKVTEINIGKTGASQYDYGRDILYVSLGASETEIIHEIGHMVDNKLLDKNKVSELRKSIIGEPKALDLRSEIYYDSAGNPMEIFLLSNDKFISKYQGRIYVDDIFDAFDKSGKFRDELLWEFISEPFREYIENPEKLKHSSEELYNLIQEALE